MEFRIISFVCGGLLIYLVYSVRKVYSLKDATCIKIFNTFIDSFSASEWNASLDAY